MLHSLWSHADAPYDDSGVDGWNIHDLVQMCPGIDVRSARDASFVVECISNKRTAWQTMDAWRDLLKARVSDETQQLREQVADLKRQVSRLTIKILRGKGL